MHDGRLGEYVQSIETARLRLSFVWTGDRWTHRIEVQGVSLVQPVELDSEFENPELVISPTYQQLNFQPGPQLGSRQALLVGQAGPHHFSAVFTVSELDDATVIDVDLADRSRSPVHSIAATFTVARTSSDLIDADRSSVEWSLGSQRLCFEAGTDCHVGLSEAGRSATRVQATASIQPQQRTQRCRYRWVVK